MIYLCGHYLRLENLGDNKGELLLFNIGENLTLDFFCQKLSLALEFQGSQHNEYNPHFKKNKKEFIQQQQRDQKKKRWCKLNEIVLIEVRENELKQNILQKKINESLRTNNL